MNILLKEIINYNNNNKKFNAFIYINIIIL